MKNRRSAPKRPVLKTTLERIWDDADATYKAANCGNCKYARPLNGNDAAISCRRLPPEITKVEGNQITSQWPLLGKDQWCGEHQPCTR